MNGSQFSRRAFLAGGLVLLFANRAAAAGASTVTVYKPPT